MDAVLPVVGEFCVSLVALFHGCVLFVSFVDFETWVSVFYLRRLVFQECSGFVVDRALNLWKSTRRGSWFDDERDLGRGRRVKDKRQLD